MTEQQLSDGLRELVRDPGVPQQLDIARGIAEGRRAARRRRIGGGMAAALGVCAVASGAVLVLPASPADRAVTPAATTKAPAPVKDPLFTRSLVVGYVPPGLPERVYGISRQEQSFNARARNAPEGGSLRGLSVGVVPPGGKIMPPRYPMVPQTLPEETGTPTTPVNGKPARCIDDPCKGLLIEHSPGRWFSVRFGGAGDQAAVTRRVAESVRLDGQEPVKLPFTVAGVPRALKPYEVQVETDSPNGPWRVGLAFSDSPDGFDPRTSLPRALSIGINPDPSRTGDDKTSGPNTTVDGHPANRTVNDEIGDLLQVFDYRGLRVSVTATGPEIAQMLGPDGTVGIFRQLRIVSDPADQTGWTDRPVR